MQSGREVFVNVVRGKIGGELTQTKNVGSGEWAACEAAHSASGEGSAVLSFWWRRQDSGHVVGFGFRLTSKFRMPCQGNVPLGRCSVQFWVQVEAALPRCFVLLDGNAMSVGPGVLTNSGDLPGNLNIRFISHDSKLVVGDLLGDDRLRELTYYGELIPEVAVEDFKPVRQCDDRYAAPVCHDVSVIDVHHVG